MAHPSKKKARKIAVAVFRGKRSNYEFDVFPVGAEIRDSPAVFIFSRRATDRLGKGHHAVVCVGETDSIYAELKKHKRAVCVKQNALNSLCILREPDAGMRSKVLDDLIAARTFGCIRNVYTAKITPAPARARKAAAAGSTLKGTAAAKSVKAATKQPKIDAKKVSKPASKAQALKPAAGLKRKSEVGRAKLNPAAAVKTASASATAKRTKSQAKPATAAKPKTANVSDKTKTAKKSKTTPSARKMPAAPSRSRSASAAAKPMAAARTIAASKPKAAAGKKKPAAAAKERALASPKSTKSSAGRKRVQGGVDSNRRQHRLSKSKNVVDRRTKSRTVKKPRPRQKAAA